MKLLSLLRRHHTGDEQSALWTKTVVVSTAILLAILAVVLTAMGRVPFCSCGFGLVTVSAWSNATSQNLLDPYSFSHLLHGLIFYWFLTVCFRKLTVRQRFFIALFLEMGWEVLENSPIIINRYREGTASLDYVGDSVLNSLGDMLSMIIGFILARKTNWKISLAAFLVVELLMLWTIRDNLTLNVIMLITPIDAVKEWQMQGNSTSSSSAPIQAPGCKVGGCSSQLCVELDDDGVSDCMYREEYACYQTATCARQADGKCGWSQTPELQQCIADARATSPDSDLQ